MCGASDFVVAASVMPLDCLALVTSGGLIPWTSWYYTKWKDRSWSAVNLGHITEITDKDSHACFEEGPYD